MKKKKSMKLKLQRETLKRLDEARFYQAVGGRIYISQGACSDANCHTDLCNEGGDTSGNIFSCASCIVATCGCYTAVADCGATSG